MDGLNEVERADRKEYLSLNIITIDTEQMRLTGRLLAQPLGGGTYLEEDSLDGLLGKHRQEEPEEDKHEHQLIYRHSILH
jgi:hypothetical protein